MNKTTYTATTSGGTTSDGAIWLVNDNKGGEFGRAGTGYYQFTNKGCRRVTKNIPARCTTLRAAIDAAIAAAQKK